MAGAFLDALTEAETDDLHSVGRRRRYGANVTLFHEGDEPGPVVVLLSGRAKVASISSAGREVIVAVRGPVTSSASCRRSTGSRARRP